MIQYIKTKILYIIYIKLTDFNPLNNFTSFDLPDNQIKKEKIHIRTKKRTARKYITTVEGLKESDFEQGLKKMLKNMKKKFSCNGSLSKDDDDNPIISFQGDQKNNISKYLIEKHDFEEYDIIIHGE